MFDAGSDDDGHNIRAVVIMTITYDGEVSCEAEIDPGDEITVASEMRACADELAKDARERRQH